MDGLVKELSEDYQLDDCIRNDNTIVFRISLCRKGFIPIMKEKYYSGSVMKRKNFCGDKRGTISATKNKNLDI